MHCVTLQSAIKVEGAWIIIQRATGTSELHTCYVWNDKQTRELITSWLKKKEKMAQKGGRQWTPRPLWLVALAISWSSPHSLAPWRPSISL